MASLTPFAFRLSPFAFRLSPFNLPLSTFAPFPIATLTSSYARFFAYMVAALILIVIGLIPPILSAWVSLRAHRRVQARFELAMEAAANHRFRDFVRRTPDEHYVEGVGLIVGDLTCQLNARSPYLRCAVNPTGPCEGCRHYQGRDYT